MQDRSLLVRGLQTMAGFALLRRSGLIQQGNFRMWNRRFEIAAPDVVAEDFDDEIVAINLETGRYYSLRQASHRAWNALCAGSSLTDITGDPEILAEEAREKAERFVTMLVADGLLRDRTVGEAGIAADPSLPMAAADLAALEVESFDDMQELILADPIHEVDEETGWPLRKPEVAS